MAYCDRPIQIENPAYAKDKRVKRLISVPCGKCYNCLTRKKDEWSLRMWLHEQQAKTATWFATITYDDDFYPGHLDKEEFKKFLKSIRTKYKNSTYMAIGEYGPTTYRAHYHVIIWNTTNDHMEIIREMEKSWNYKGNVQVDLCNGNRIGYLAAHQFNRLISPDAENPPFRLVSKGIGKTLKPQLEQYVKEQLPTALRDDANMLHPIPKYVLEKTLKYKNLIQHISNKKVKFAEKSLLRDTRTPTQRAELLFRNDQKLKEALKKRKWL